MTEDKKETVITEISCFEIRCIECREHAIVDGKIVCNRANRLKLRKVSVTDYLMGDKSG